MLRIWCQARLRGNDNLGFYAIALFELASFLHFTFVSLVSSWLHLFNYKVNFKSILKSFKKCKFCSVFVKF